jgi:ABC-type nitrate/sulfonate/bicarbonate transport system substrate-binding protein
MMGDEQGTAQRSGTVPLRVRVFPGVQNLPLFAGQARGFFARHGLAIALQATTNSQTLRDGLAAGDFEIAHAAIDNAIAMVETAGVDVVAVMGGSDGLNELIVQPDVHTAADLRGRTVIVDAPNTAYALQLRKILSTHGLIAGRDYIVQAIGGTSQRLQAMRANQEYAASMLSPPFSILAERAGLRSLGLAVRLLGPYQATAGFVLRSWAEAHAAALERYIRAYVESLRWAVSPTNREEAVALLGARLDLPADVAAVTYARAADPVGGLTPDARLDLEGLRAVLRLRAELEGCADDGGLHAPNRYYDPRYYERALAVARSADPE